MRTMALVVGGIGATALAALLVFDGAPSQAQQSKPVADSITAPVIADTGSLKGPRQPIFFRHDIHAGQFKMQCQYCHYSVAVSPEPGIPSMQTCMGCHLVVSGGDSSAKAEKTKGEQRLQAAQKKGDDADKTVFSIDLRTGEVTKLFTISASM